jgi:hypothetical protein
MMTAELVVGSPAVEGAEDHQATLNAASPPTRSA